MFLNLCPYTIGIKDLSFENLLSLAVRFGFDGIDFIPSQFSSLEKALEAGNALEKSNLQWGLFPMPCDFLAADDHEFFQGIHALEKTLPFIKAAGCTRTYNHIWPGNNVRQYNENFKWHVERLRILGDLLEEYGVKYGLEFIGPKTLRDSFIYPFVNNIFQAAELIDAASPALGLVLDFFHFYTSGGTLEDLSSIGLGDKIVNIHANDAYPGRTREEQMDMERGLPMSSGIIDAQGILKALRDMKYTGPVICEPFEPTISKFRSMEDKDIALEVSTIMKKLLVSPK